MAPPKTAQKKPATVFMAFRADSKLAQAMAELKKRDGISTSEQMRRALEKWLTTKGVYTPKEKKR